MSLIGLLAATEKQVHLGRLHNETHTVASQKQLEGTGIPKKSDSYPQVTAPPLTTFSKVTHYTQ